MSFFFPYHALASQKTIFPMLERIASVAAIFCLKNVTLS